MSENCRMSEKTKATETPGAAPVKKVGRRPKSGQDVSRDAMIECAVRIARSESLNEVSMVRIGKEIGVAAGMVHYHLGSRGNQCSIQGASGTASHTHRRLASRSGTVRTVVA
jgi:hypothetical protein